MTNPAHWRTWGAPRMLCAGCGEAWPCPAERAAVAKVADKVPAWSAQDMANLTLRVGRLALLAGLRPDLFPMTWQPGVVLVTPALRRVLLALALEEAAHPSRTGATAREVSVRAYGGPRAAMSAGRQLARLERLALVRSEPVDDTRLFEITDRGRTALQALG